MTEPSGLPPIENPELRWQPRAEVRVEAHVSDGGDAYLAGRDQHIHLADGLRRARPSPGAEDLLCPYPGLAPFGAQQQQWFYGRDQMVAAVCERLDARIREGGPLILIGPSGAGKSSLLAAGVLPALARGGLPAAGSSRWPRLVLTPTASPALALAYATGLNPLDARRAAETWRADPERCLADLRATSLAGASAGLVVVVDQFEEVFTAGADEAERQWFIEVLDRLAGPAGGAVVVLGVRADFYAACTAYPQLRAALRAGPVLLDPMTETELRQAIRLPAQDVGLEVEAGLVEVLLADLGSAGSPVGTGAGAAGRLPLLAHALRATWQQRHGHTLTVDGYRVTGGIQRAIATTADRLFDALPPNSHETARRVFLRLVIVGRDGDDTRRRVKYDDLLYDATDPQAAALVVDNFTAGRLLTRDRDTVTITHEVLIRAWPRLHGWIEQDRAGNLVRQDVEEVAAGWQQADREPAALYRGNRLETALAWAETHGSDLSATGRAFLAAAGRHQRRGQRLRRSVVFAITVLAVAASATAVFAFGQEARARAATVQALHSRDQAIDSQVTAESQQVAPTDPSLSAQLALVAYRMSPTAAAASRLITTENTPLETRLSGPSGSVYTVAYSPDGDILAAGNVDQNTVRLWDVSDPSDPVALGQPLPEATAVDSVLSLAFSPDGHTLAVAGSSGSSAFVDLWDLTSPSNPVRSGGALNDSQLGSFESVAFSPDGRTLAAADSDGDVSLWNVSQSDGMTPDGRPLELTCFPVQSLAFSPNGISLATACDDAAGSVNLWNTTDPSHVVSRGPSLKAGDGVTSVAFSPDGHTLAASTGVPDDDDVHLWNTTDPNHPAVLGKPLTGPAQGVMSVEFSPDGHILAAGSADHTIHLWNVTDPTDISPLGQPLAGPSDGIDGIAFSPDSHTLAAGDLDGDVDLWNLPSTQVAGAGGPVSSVAFSPDGDTMAVGNANDTVSLWNTADPDHPAPLGTPLTGPTELVTSVAFSRDGHLLAAGDSGGTVTLWNTTDPDHPTSQGPPLTGADGEISSLAFGPDSHTLAGAGDSASGDIAIWDLTDPADTYPETINTQAARFVESVAFSPDGRTLAAGGNTSNGQVGLWTATGPNVSVRIGEPIQEPANTSTWVAFSPDGRTLAAANSHGTVTLWNSTNPNHLTQRGQPITVPDGSPWSVVFSPDGKTLAVAGHASLGTINLWNVSNPNLPVAIGVPLTVATGGISVLAFSPDNHSLAATTGEGLVTVWDLNVQAAIQRICADSARALGAQQWTQYVSQLPYTSPCSGT